MPDEKNDVYILSWPKDKARLEHTTGKPCEVTIVFDEKPANVVIQTTPEKPVHVDMAMSVLAKETIPICLKLCEPICADSDYTVGVNLMGKPFAAITVQGRTRLTNCEPERPKLTCVDFTDLKPDMTFREPFFHHEVKFSPVKSPLVTSYAGGPAGQLKLGFPSSGVRIDFPYPVNDATVTASNPSGTKLRFRVFVGNTVAQQVVEPVGTQARKFAFAQPGMTAIFVSTDSKRRGALVQVCYGARAASYGATTQTPSSPDATKLTRGPC